MIEQCNRYTPAGGRCELGLGHAGRHFLTRRNWSGDAKAMDYGKPTGTFEWDETDQRLGAAMYGSRFD